MTKIIRPGAWELTATNPICELSAIYVPTTWRQVANNLAQQRGKLKGQRYRAVPVYSLDPLIVGSFPQIIKCDDGERSLYLSIRKGLNTEQDILRKWQSRLDNGNRQAGKARILEIVLIHHPEIAGDKLAHFVHSLRSRWPYFANDVVLPLPFPFAIKAKEYAISTKDPLESSETDDSNF